MSAGGSMMPEFPPTTCWPGKVPGRGSSRPRGEASDRGSTTATAGQPRRPRSTTAAAG